MAKNPESSRYRLLAPVVIACGALALAARRAGSAYSYRGKVALITGGSRGLGFLIARELAREGASVALVARTATQLEEARARLERLGATVQTQVCDIGDRQSMLRAVQEIEARLGPVDILVNNASIIQVGPFETMRKEDFEAAMSANFWGTFHATEAVLPSMRARRAGRIINVTSIGAEVPVPHLMPYTVAKFAAYGFSLGMRAELAKAGIRVVTIVPGLMRTGSFLNALFKGKGRAEFNWFSWGSTLPVISMDAERAARRIVTACRRGESFVTLGMPAKILRVAYRLAPGWMSGLFGWVNRLLPGPQGPDDVNQPPEPGSGLRGPLSSPPITTLGDRAAGRFNELTG